MTDDYVDRSAKIDSATYALVRVIAEEEDRSMKKVIARAVQEYAERRRAKS